MNVDRPLCFVLMPFGTKKDPGGGPEIDFDRVYDDAIRLAIQDAEMQPVRADEERTGGIIHKAMFERLLLCDFAVADLTTGNANVFYELGVRHAVRSATTLAVFAKTRALPPFDVNYLRALPYELGDGNRFGTEQASMLRVGLARRLIELRSLAREHAPTDSPLFQLLEGYPVPDIARLKTDVFREQVEYSSRLKQELAEARSRRDSRALAKLEEKMGELDSVEAGVLVDLFLSYRALSAWDRMVGLYERLPAALKRTMLVREQLGFALNRLGERDRSIRVLEEVLRERGPSSETHGLLGRVYKDLWAQAVKDGDEPRARGHLERAISHYVQGFEADWRDAYPGINAVTLLDIRGGEKASTEKARLLPVVRFAVLRRIESVKPDYWDHATMLELAVLEGDEEGVQEHLGNALALQREAWEAGSTANNLGLIREAKRKRSETQEWLDRTIATLEQAASVRSR